jgi:hypothetical protein
MRVPVVSRQRIRPRRYDIRDWSLAVESPGRLVYRPSLLTLSRRLMRSALILIVFAPFVYYGLKATSRDYFEPTPHEQAVFEEEAARLSSETSQVVDSMRERMSAEERATFEAKIEANERRRAYEQERARSQLEQTRRWANIAAVAFACLLGFTAAAGPLSCAWQRVSIFREPCGGLTVKKRGLWPSTVSVPQDGIHRLSVRAAEVIHRRRHAGISRLGHRWSISLELGPSGPGKSGDLDTLEFHVHYQKLRPMESEALPERVARLVGALEQMTGLKAGPPTIMDLQDVRMGLFGPRWVVAGKGEPFVIKRMLEKPIVRTRTYSLDELPPELQSQAGDLADKTRATGKTYTRSLSVGDAIKFRDADGSVHTYSSPQEMPPDVRELYEQMRRMADHDE